MLLAPPAHLPGLFLAGEGQKPDRPYFMHDGVFDGLYALQSLRERATGLRRRDRRTYRRLGEPLRPAIGAARAP
jgi:hypothetical protein